MLKQEKDIFTILQIGGESKMAGKIEKLERIMQDMKRAEGFEEEDMTLVENPARVYFNFELKGDNAYAHNLMSVNQVVRTALKYGLVKDNSDNVIISASKFAMRFKLIPYRR